MIWFRLAFVLCLLSTLTWDIGVLSGIFIMFSVGAEQQSIYHDPTKNGTITIYVFIVMFQIALAISALFAVVIAFKVWRNQFQLDKDLRHQFILWFVSWIISMLGLLGIDIYAFVKAKDPQGQLGYMFEMFQRYSQDQKFIASFERYQREHSCCGVYGPDDWLMAQLRQQPGASAFQAFDFGMQMNPATGKCHVLPPTIPIGCGQSLIYEVNKIVTLYASLSIAEIVLGIGTAVLAWYAFFYWLEEEVIVLPTDELDEIVVIEPPDPQAEAELFGEDEDEESSVEELYPPSSRRPTSRLHKHSYIHHSYLGPSTHTTRASQRPHSGIFHGSISRPRRSSYYYPSGSHPSRGTIGYLRRDQLQATSYRPSRAPSRVSRISVVRAHRNPTQDTRYSRRDGSISEEPDEYPHHRTHASHNTRQSRINSLVHPRTRRFSRSRSTPSWD